MGHIEPLQFDILLLADTTKGCVNTLSFQRYPLGRF